MLDALNIFNPKKVFINELPGSWCDNIVTHNKDPNIPIEKSDPPSLRLDSKDEKEYFIGVIPICRDWSLIDLSGYHFLNFNMTTDKTSYPMVSVQMTSGDEGNEKDSKMISISKYGLMEYSTQDFSIDLNEFNGDDGFDIKQARLIKFIGHGNFLIALTNIVIKR